jgi:hypothetical protein
MGRWGRELGRHAVTDEDETIRRVAIDERECRSEAPTDRRLTPEVGQVWLQSARQQTSPFVEGPTSPIQGDPRIRQA